MTTLMIISIASQKGGVAKTSSAISISAGIAYKNKKTLLIDMDSQANTSKVLIPHYLDLRPENTIYNTIINKEPLPIHQTAVSKLDIVPSHIFLSKADTSLAAEIDRHSRLKKQLQTVKKNYEYIFLDCPPTIGFLTINALVASDEVIIVTAPGFFELDSLKQFSETVGIVQEEYNPLLKLKGILFCKSMPTVESRDSLAMLRQAYGKFVFHTIIPMNVALKEAHFNRKDIFSYDPNSRAAQEYARFINEAFGL